MSRASDGPAVAVLAVAALLSGCAAAAPVPVSATVAYAAPAPPLVLEGEGRGLARAPSMTYGALDGAECERWLAWRRIPFVRAGPVRGVDRPVRLTGPLRGVDFHGEPASARRTSLYEVLDCRLALALDDLAATLAKSGIVEVVHMSMYRPPPLEGGHRRKPSQHEAGLAIDVGRFVRRDGARLVVQTDWHGAIGARTCGGGAGPRVRTPQAEALRGLLCDVAEQRLFTVMLTPNHDARHFNHFHLDVTRGASWFIVK